MFPKILRRLRLEQKFTQSDMAKALNISRVAYTNYELGNREPDFDTVMRISHILGTTVDYLLGNSSFRTPQTSASPSHQAKNDFVLPQSLRLIMLSVSELTRESCADLQKYIELLKIREDAKSRPARGRFKQSDHSDLQKNGSNGLNH